MCSDNIKTYVPLHTHSFHSLLDGLPSPKEIVNRCVELGLPGTAITDHGNISAMKTFYDAAKKKNIKSIIGIEAYICVNSPTIKTKENNKRYHLIILAKNDQGIKDLMALVSQMNRSDHFYHKPRIDLNGIKPFAKHGNLIALSGCIAGELSSSLFQDFAKTLSLGGHGENLDIVRQTLRPDWKIVGTEIIRKYIKVFGKNNFYIELQDEGMSAQTIAVECLRILGKELDVPTVATIDSHYCRKEDAEDQRLLLYANLHTTREEQQRRISCGKEVMDFMVSDNYYIPSYQEMRQKFTEKELQTTINIADKINYSSLGRPPCLPNFTNEESKKLGLDSNAYLRYLCIAGAQNKLSHLASETKRQYWDRLQRELIVIKEAKLADYFLIVWDVCRFVDQNKMPRGKARGSGAGSLVNYLIDITKIDPIEYGLYFERFYNISRNIPPHFDVGQVSFMSWMTDNFELLYTRNVEAERKAVAKHLANRIKKYNVEITDTMKEEVVWIDQNNPNMWMYLNDMIQQKPAHNSSNSHLAYGLGITIKERNELDVNHKVKIHNGHISLPDIDTDIGVICRNQVIEYIKQRWGDSYVSQMITFNSLQGRAALKEVFRAQPETVKQLMKVKALKEGKDPNEISVTPHDLCNEITQHIPDEAAIADELNQAREEHGDNYGILQWAIEHIDFVQEAYQCYRPLFDQAIRIEGTKKSQSRHAAGIVIANKPISKLVPLAHDSKNQNCIVGLEMYDAEAMGAVKFDFLGIVALDKLWMIQDLINNSAKDKN